MKILKEEIDLELYENEFIVSVIVDYNTVLKKITELSNQNSIRSKEYENSVKDYFTRSKKEVYIHNVSLRLNPVLNALERLSYIPHLIKTFSLNKTHKKNGIDEHEWIKYNFSNYLIYKNTLYDTILLLVNEVFLMRHSPSKSLRNRVFKEFKKFKIDVSPLIEIEQLTKSDNDKRNLLIHRNEVPENESLDQLEKQLFLYKQKRRMKWQLEKKEEEHEDLLKRIYKSERKELAKELFEKNTLLKKSVIKILIMLKPTFERAKKVLSEKKP